MMLLRAMVDWARVIVAAILVRDAHRLRAMTATGQVIGDRDDAAATAAIESALHSKEHVKIKEHVVELQQTVRQLQRTIDSQGASLQRIQALVDRLLSATTAPAAMSATTASSGASAPAIPVAAGAPTAVGTVSAQAAVAGPVYPSGSWLQPNARCHTCRVVTSVCEHALYDDNARNGCLRNQGWSKSRASNWWCPQCWPNDEKPPQWPVQCYQSHGIRDGAATLAPTSSPSEAALPAPPAPWGSPSAAPPPLAVVQPAAQTW